MNDLDRITGQRSAALALYGLTFALWQLSQLHGLRAAVPQLFAPLCILLWIASAAYLLWQTRRHGARTEGDEMSAAHRARALAAGYWSTTLLTAAALAIDGRVALAPADLLRLLLVAAVAIPVLVYFYLERRSDRAE